MRQRKYSNIDFKSLSKKQLLQMLERDPREVVRSMRYRGYVPPIWVEEYIMEHCEDLWTYTNSYYNLCTMIKFDKKLEEYTLVIDKNIIENVPDSVLRKFIKTRLSLFKPELIKDCSPRVRCIYMEVKLGKNDDDIKM